MSQEDFQQIPRNMLDCQNSQARDCLSSLASGYYTNKKGENVEIDYNYCLTNTKSYPPNYEFKNIKEDGGCKGIIQLRVESTLDACHRLVVLEGKENVCALNFANPFKPGGGFDVNARAQEETLCRSSALYWSLIQKLDFYEYHIKQNKPESSSYTIFSPECPTWKLGDYSKLDKPYFVSYITSAAVINRETLDRDYVISCNDEKIRRILLTAIENGVKHLILGAYGCGAFCNDPEDIAKIFKKYLIEQNLKSHFDEIVFSIIGYTTTNYDVFSKVFNEY